MSFRVTGTLQVVFDTQQITARFQKREFVVEVTDNPKYPQPVLFQLTGDRCAELDRFRVGDEVDIEFRLRGREWTSPKGDVKYFNSLDVWTLEPAGASAGPGRGDEEPPPPDDRFAPADDGDDVPF